MFVAPNVASITSSVPISRRRVASGMSSTFVNTWFLLSIAISFSIFASNVPLNPLQQIFAGSDVSITQGQKNSFIMSMRTVFLLMALVNAAVLPSYLASKREGQQE